MNLKAKFIAVGETLKPERVMILPKANDTIQRRVFVNFRVGANATLSCPMAF